MKLRERLNAANAVRWYHNNEESYCSLEIERGQWNASLKLRGLFVDRKAPAVLQHIH